MKRTQLQRFWEHVFMDADTGCWLWTGACTAKGYGHFDKGRAHRIAYELFVGPITEGFHVDHLCQTPRCVNPIHLEAVTPRENSIRGDGPAGSNYRKTHCKHGHLFDDKNTYIALDGTRHCRACHRDSWMRVGRVTRRKRRAEQRSSGAEGLTASSKAAAFSAATSALFDDLVELWFAHEDDRIKDQEEAI